MTSFSRLLFIACALPILSSVASAQNATQNGNNQFTGSNEFAGPFQVEDSTTTRDPRLYVDTGTGNVGVQTSTPGYGLELRNVSLAQTTTTLVTYISTGVFGMLYNLLPDGTVLEAGGYTYTSGNVGLTLSSASVFNPLTGLWTAIPNAPTRISKDGYNSWAASGSEVVSFGGAQDFSCNAISSVTYFNSASRTWGTATNLSAGTVGMFAITLSNGKILFGGGSFASYVPGECGNSGAQSTTWLYDPHSNTYSATGSLNNARGAAGIAALLNGKILVAGGATYAIDNTPTALMSAEIYDPSNGTWTTAGVGSLATARFDFPMFTLPNGNIIAVGGDSTGLGFPTNQVEIFFSTGNSWGAAAALPVSPNGYAMSDFGAAQLQNGNILVVGGFNNPGTPIVSSLTYVYDWKADTWTTVGPYPLNLSQLGTVTLANGEVLGFGGAQEYLTQSYTTATVYNPYSKLWETSSINPQFLAQTTGNVGIGTPAPMTPLDVNGIAQFGSTPAKSTFTASGNLQLISGSTITTAGGTLTISTGPTGGAANFPSIFVSSTGNVGIGLASPQTLLDVAGQGQFGAGPQKSTITATGNLQMVSGSTITSAGGSLTFSTGPSAAGNNYPAIFINTNGNVGVGISSPTVPLQVNGAALFQSSVSVNSGGRPIILSTSSTGPNSLQIETAGGITAASSATFQGILLAQGSVLAQSSVTVNSGGRQIILSTSTTGPNALQIETSGGITAASSATFQGSVLALSSVTVNSGGRQIVLSTSATGPNSFQIETGGGITIASSATFQGAILAQSSVTVASGGRQIILSTSVTGPFAIQVATTGAVVMGSSATFQGAILAQSSVTVNSGGRMIILSTSPTGPYSVQVETSGAVTVASSATFNATGSYSILASSGVSAGRFFGLGAVPVGAIVGWSTTTAPAGWLLCDGSTVSRTGYSELFNLISTTFGSGDGSTNFNLPDMRQRFPLGKAASGTGSTFAGTGGSIDLTVTVPAHYHGMGTGADLNITSSGSHNHQTFNGGGRGSGAFTGDSPPRYAGASGNSGFSPNTDTSGNHTHPAGNFSGRIGLVTGGVDGNSSMTSGSANPPFLVIDYIIYAGK